jgi:NDP-sugar pyrophosphorylase family protein
MTMTHDDFQLVIPMSGIGSRFLSKGYETPKFLIQVEGKPVIEHVLEMYPEFQDVLFIVNETHANDKELALLPYLNGLREHVKVKIIPNHKFGPSWALLQAEEELSQSKVIVVNYCDFTCLWEINELFELMLPESGVDGLIACYTGFQPHYLRSTHYAFVMADEKRKVLTLREKEPYTNDPTREWGSSGTYVFKNSKMLISAIQKQISQDISKFGEYFTSLTYLPLLNEGLNVRILPVRKFMQWGTPEDFEDYLYYSNTLKKLLNNKSIDKGNTQDTKVVLAAGRGERFKVVGYSVPKLELTFDGVTIISKIVDLIGGEVKIYTKLGLLSQDSITQLNQSSAEIQYCEQHPSSQVESCIEALNSFDLDSNEPITILSCDSLISFNGTNSQSLDEYDAVVWVSNPNPINSINMNQTTWVDYDEGNRITNHVVYKGEPQEFRNPKVLTGAFTFKNKFIGIEMLNKVKELNSVNGEHYIDQILSLRSQGIFDIAIAFNDTFLSLGTPAEYESAIYWLEAFSAWPSHELYRASNE